MAYDARKERFFLLNKVLYKCVSSHYKTLLSLGIELVPSFLVSVSHPQVSHFHFYYVINMSSTAQQFICIFIQKCININCINYKYV